MQKSSKKSEDEIETIMFSEEIYRKQLMHSHGQLGFVEKWDTGKEK